MPKHTFCPYCMNLITLGEPCGVCGLDANSYSPAAHHLPPGTVLQDRYLVGKVLEEGLFGIIYIGFDRLLGVKRTIKEYFPALDVSREASKDLNVRLCRGRSNEGFKDNRASCLREARLIAKLEKQQAILNVCDFFEANQTAYIVTEYVDGTTFQDLRIQRGGKIPARELLPLIEPLFSALQAIHDARLLHLNINPGNLVIEDGAVRLFGLDWVLQRMKRGAYSDESVDLRRWSAYEPIERTLSSPEKCGPWTDVYALGATIYHCLTGVKPPIVLDRITDDRIIPPRLLCADLTRRQEDVLLMAMNTRPRLRYQSMREFHNAFYEVSED